jgi:hypothetical protein
MQAVIWKLLDFRFIATAFSAVVYFNAGSAGSPKTGLSKAAVEDDNSDDDWDTGKAASKKKKGGRKKGAAKQKGSGPAAPSQGNKSKHG